MFAIYVDADACPVKDEVFRVAERHRWQVLVVANRWLRLPDDDTIRMVVVGEDPDAADDWISDRIGSGDIAVTADIPLADRCLKKGAAVLDPTGKTFDADSIGMALAMRDLSSHLRDGGQISGGGPAFSAKDRSRFLQTLEQEIQSAKRNHRQGKYNIL
jgi:uncharacterized protein YaiI (UPF0178 family)